MNYEPPLRYIQNLPYIWLYGIPFKFDISKPGGGVKRERLGAGVEDRLRPRRGWNRGGELFEAELFEAVMKGNLIITVKI